MSYSTAPPSYGASSTTNKYARDTDASAPLLGGGAGPSNGGGIYDQPDDTPDDFKYGVSVSESSLEIRHAFIRKVYSILFFQILATCIIGGVLSHSPTAVSWVLQNVWVFFVAIIGTFVTLGFLYWKRHDHPTNLILLSLFTVLEASTLGIAIAFYDQVIVLQALLLTLGVFLGLTLFTLQSKYDFSGMGPYLYGALLAFIMTGLVGMFFPFSRTIDLVYAVGGCLLFSCYIIYDTFIITTKLSPDEYIMGAISLYLDFINLFLSILRVLNNAESR